MRSLLLAPLVVALVPALGCAQAQLSVSARTTDALALSAEDAATEDGGTGAQLLLHVLRTEAHVGGGGDAEGEGDDGDSAGWTVVSDAARDVDLVALSGSPDEIADGPVPVGKLTQLRLVLDPERPATLVVDGDETAVDVPSAADSGLKLRASPALLLTADAPVALTVRVDGLLERATDRLTVSPVLELMVEE